MHDDDVRDERYEFGRPGPDRLLTLPDGTVVPIRTAVVRKWRDDGTRDGTWDELATVEVRLIKIPNPPAGFPPVGIQVVVTGNLAAIPSPWDGTTERRRWTQQQDRDRRI